MKRIKTKADVKTKSDLYTFLIYIPTCEVRTEINRIISENRNIDENSAKLKRLIRPSEVTEVLDFFGVEDENKTEQKPIK